MFSNNCITASVAFTNYFKALRDYTIASSQVNFSMLLKKTTKFSLPLKELRYLSDEANTAMCTHCFVLADAVNRLSEAEAKVIRMQ